MEQPTPVLRKRRNSISSRVGMISDRGCFIKRSKSLSDISLYSLATSDVDLEFKNELDSLRAAKVKGKCINGCGTPPSSKETDSSEKSSKLDDVDFDEEDDFIADRFNDDCGAILSTPALLLPNYYLEKVN